MQVTFKRLYSCKLVEDLEKERQKVLMGGNAFVSHDLAPAFIRYSQQYFITKYCQMGVNRRWHDYFQEVTKNHRLDEEGRFDEMTMPEMMTDKSSWTEEDHKVFQALLAAKQEKVER